jgi:cell fate regulator YaaT (PSP1 superfamily)
MIINFMKKVGIRFKSAGKVYDFDSGAFVLNIGDHVIVETEQGMSFGSVVVPPEPYDDSTLEKPFKKVYRLATAKDFEEIEKNKEREKIAYTFCQECIKELKLEMNLFSVESTLDGSKLTFFFTADGRIDFRQLVKMLVKELGCRIEMRQVGIRNQTKMTGGLGRCGRSTCCSTFLEKFEPISIRMAKEQGLSLNPTKISGQCGRLMCCLTFENETYRLLKKDFPAPGKIVTTKHGPGKVVRLNPICSRLTVRLESGAEMEIRLDELTTIQEQEIQ